MHISSPLPEEQVNPGIRIGPSGPAPRQDTGGWHQDFARQFGAEQRVMAQTTQMGENSTYGYSPWNGDMGMSMGMGMGMRPQFAGGMVGHQAEGSMAQHHQAEEAFDEEAFERAFDEAANAEQTNEARELEQNPGWMNVSSGFEDAEIAQAGKLEMELGQDIMLEESAERLMSSEQQIPNQARLGADLIHDPMSESKEHPQHEDPDALARTAGQLLDSVRNNQSAKFQNSEFLELMRQLRDREVMVKGDNIVETNSGNEGETEGIKVDAP